MKYHMKFIALTAMALLAQASFAQSAGSYLARIGATTIAPQVTSGAMSAPSFPNSTTDVGSATALSGGITYMATDNLSLDVPVAIPFKHKLYGAGALASAGQIGEVQALPVTLFVQYRLMNANSAFRPYIGLGATYAYFSNATGTAALTAMTNPGGPPTKITVDSKFTLTPQIGASLTFANNYFVDVFYSQTKLSTTTKLSTGQSLEVAIDPRSYGIAIGKKF
jgi:outer membrane protein